MQWVTAWTACCRFHELHSMIFILSFVCVLVFMVFWSTVPNLRSNQFCTKKQIFDFWTFIVLTMMNTHDICHVGLIKMQDSCTFVTRQTCCIILLCSKSHAVFNGGPMTYILPSILIWHLTLSQCSQANPPMLKNLANESFFAGNFGSWWFHATLPPFVNWGILFTSPNTCVLSGHMSPGHRWGQS